MVSCDHCRPSNLLPSAYAKVCLQQRNTHNHNGLLPLPGCSLFIVHSCDCWDIHRSQIICTQDLASPVHHLLSAGRNTPAFDHELLLYPAHPMPPNACTCRLGYDKSRMAMDCPSPWDSLAGTSQVCCLLVVPHTSRILFTLLVALAAAAVLQPHHLPPAVYVLGCRFLLHLQSSAAA